MKQTAIGAAFGLLALVILGLIVWAEVSTWTECRQTNSWFYCVRVLSR